METIYYVINFLVVLAGILCVAMICVSIFQIMTGEEGECRKYQVRIKHGIIALILIISISSVKNMVLTYFPYVQSNDAIGDFSEIQICLTDGALNEKKEDCQ